MLQWKKKPGEAVAIDEILIEIETDKVVLEVPAPSAGVLAEIVAGDGATVVADQVIAKIDTEGKASAAAPAAAPAAPAAAAPAPAAAAAAAAAGGSKSDVAMPAAAKLLADNKLTTGDVAGTGKDGRVTKGDVLGAVAGGATAKVAAPVADSHGRAQDGAAASGLARRRAGPRRAPGRARADEPPARPHRRAPAAVAVDQRHPDHLQRGQHGARSWRCASASRRSSRRSTASRSAS